MNAQIVHQPPQDRYAGLTGTTSFRGSFRGTPRGLGRGGFRGGGMRGFRGGGGGFSQGGRDFSNQELYADYNGPDQPGAGATYGSGGAGYSGGGSSGFGGGGGAGSGGGAPYTEGDPSQQIMVRNVSKFGLLL